VTDKEALNVLVRNCVDVVSKEELLKKLESGKKLVVKLGVDPTSPDLHLGHSVVLGKMRDFQDLGHQVVLVIGDFTASVGDPSGRDATRPVLSFEQIRENARTYVEQAFRILDSKKTKITYNSEWLRPFVSLSDSDKNVFSPLLGTLSKVTLARLVEREDFKTRMKQESPISMLELLYPVFQGYDSVALKADVELGGSDQLFNLLVGRDLQRDEGQDPQIVMTLPLLVGTDGTKKMSKSYKNYIGLTDRPEDMFGKVMSISDELMLKYYEILTKENLGDIEKLHPMVAKKKLAGIIVERFHNGELAEKALENFEQVFSKKQNPDDMPEFKVKNGQRLAKIMVESGLVKSMNEARRLISQNAVKLDGKKIDEDITLELNAEAVLQIGSKRFCKLIL
jgi:tyrosyl-tRNA synthetase